MEENGTEAGAAYLHHLETEDGMISFLLANDSRKEGEDLTCLVPSTFAELFSSNLFISHE